MSFGDPRPFTGQSLRVSTLGAIEGTDDRIREGRITAGLILLRSKRYGTVVGLVLLDIDDFKAINDTTGGHHQQGDVVLREVARVLRQGEITVTTSCGVAAVPPIAPDQAALEAAADHALYRAKETGKNKTVRYHDERSDRRPAKRPAVRPPSRQGFDG